jgi:hypothetical protein
MSTGHRAASSTVLRKSSARPGRLGEDAGRGRHDEHGMGALGERNVLHGIRRLDRRGSRERGVDVLHVRGATNSRAFFVI